MSKPETTEKMFEARISRLEKYLQREGHQITKYDELPADGPKQLTGDTEAGPLTQPPISQTTIPQWIIEAYQKFLREAVERNPFYVRPKN